LMREGSDVKGRVEYQFQRSDLNFKYSGKGWGGGGPFPGL